MLRILIIVALIGLLALLIWRIRAGRIELRASKWPLGQQAEAALAALLGAAAILGALAGEFTFAGWLLLVSAATAALALLSWPKQD